MDIHNICETVRLIKKVNCQNAALVTEIAKEMGVKKTALMLYIEQNPKLFHTKESNKGLLVTKVYEVADRNPETEEWLDRMKTEWDKKLHVGEMGYYGQHEFWYFPEEYEKDYMRYHLWRNTPEKFKELEEMGILKKTTRCYGGFGDSSTAEAYILNSEVLDKLAAAGWTTDFDEVSKS